jgi:hypothetical protein
MLPKRLRVGIRTQLTLIVLVAALLGTIATLYIANSAIQSYVIDQAKLREQQNLQVALLVLHTEFGDNVSIDVKGNLVADSPRVQNVVSLSGQPTTNDFLPYPLNDDVDYVDEVHHLVGGVVAVYQCADAQGNIFSTGCPRISTNIPKISNGQTVPGTRNLSDKLNDSILQYVQKHQTPFVGQDTVSGTQYMAAYQALYSPQKDFIGVIFVAEPLSGIQNLIVNTTVQLAVVGALIMIVGAIFAILLAQAITSTLQNAARQVSGASEKFGTIAAQQASGSAQQVWAINALSQALRNLSETATDIAKRSEQLAQMGSQVLQRRAEVSPAQVDSILNYVTRSTYDIGVASRQQAATVERMNGAMQAVMEVAQQVANDSQQTTEGAERLEQVVRQLQHLVGAGGGKGTAGKASKTNMMMTTSSQGETENASERVLAQAPTAPPAAIRSVRPTVERMTGPASGRVSMLSEPAGEWPPAFGANRSLASSGMNPFGPENPALRSGFLRPTEEAPVRSGPLRPTEDSPFRSGFMRPTERGNSGDPGAFPSLDSWNFPDQQENLNPPTFQPPRRDPGRR